MNEPGPTESLPGGQASTGESTRPLASVLRVDQCQRWTRGERIQVEEYLKQYPALQLDREGVLDLIYNEVVLRERENETPQLEEYLQRFPQFAVQLRHQFDVHQVLEASHLPAAAKTPSEEVSALNSPKAAPEDQWTAAGYEILREVGRGGMGIVYQAFDQKRAERVALKTLQRMSPAALYRFKQEFRALADVAHPNLVNLYELISDGQTWFFTMEFVEGVNFLAYVRSGANLLESETVHDLTQAAGAAPADPGVQADLAPTQLGRLREGLAQLAEAVSALHDAGKLHRDIKPSNVLVTKEGRVVLLDFGLATELDQSGLHQSAEQRVMGTAAYMAPEQAAGLSVSAASDWYSVGVVLYEALTGRRPFRGKSLQVLMDKQRFEPPAPSQLLPGIPEDLDCLCRELLRRRPEERPRGPEILRRLQRTTALSNAPLCPRMLPAQASAFVGRERHLTALTEAFLTSKQRRTVAVYVHGRSGLGKSALVQRFLDGLVERDEAVVLAGRCYERESVPYKALDSLIDALTRYLARLPRLEVETLLPRDVLPLARVFPVLREIEAVAAAPRRAFESFDARELRRRAFAALRELLARLGDRKPLVLAIDDLQWGDVDSAVLLANLLEPPDPPVLLLVGCYRSEEEASPVLQILKPRGRTDSTVDQRELAVDVLTEAEAQDLAMMLLGQDDPPTAAHAAAIARESGGNPFFVYELVRYLQTGAEPANRSSPAETVALDKVLWTRVLGLPETARRLLEVVAVAGRPLRQTDACRSANLTGEDRALLAVLRAGHMVRRTSPGESEEIETYHDRIRETVVAHLAADTLKTHHGRLAVTLETSGNADPETLGVHFRGAEDVEKAGHYYALAADKAAEALAFVRAARLYRLSLELRPLEEYAAREMRMKLGDALANAGHGPEAAREYQAASLGAGADERLDLQRRAAYQYLISGHFDDGHAALEAVLRAVGMKLPATPRRALLSLIAHRAWLRIRGLGFRKREAAQIPAAELRRLDICWSTSIGLAIIDIIRAADFQTRGMLLALKAGDPLRIIRALAIEAIHMAAGGGRTRRRTAILLGETEKLAQQLAHPYAEGVATLA
jgi:eukaryotic-like serine/threonine-protein kinase